VRRTVCTRSRQGKKGAGRVNPLRWIDVIEPARGICILGTLDGRSWSVVIPLLVEAKVQ